MRITASFVRRPRAAAPLAVTLWAMAFALAALAGWFASGFLEIRAEQPRLEARLARLEAQLAAATPAEPLPPAPELHAVRLRVAALNGLSKVQGWNTARLLEWFEREMPADVQLASLHHKSRDGEALLVAESPSAAALTGFLLRLEKERRFSEVLLSKQGARAAGASKVVQFEIRVRLAP